MITYTDIKNFLKLCIFNPRKSGPLTIIADIGNPNYYETRAIELIKEAQILEMRLGSNLPYYDESIIKAIQLLALARITRHNQIKELCNNES